MTERKDIKVAIYVRFNSQKAFNEIYETDKKKKMKQERIMEEGSKILNQSLAI